MPGRAGGVAPGGRTATYTESTLYPFFFAISNVTYFLSGEVLPENTPVSILTVKPCASGDWPHPETVSAWHQVTKVEGGGLTGKPQSEKDVILH
jgi:hypothetical protein